MIILTFVSMVSYS